jgi:hypothetical protein
MKDILLKTKPKKAIITLFVVSIVSVILVSGFYATLITAVITNTLIFAYGLYLLGKEDYDSLRFFFMTILVLGILNILLTIFA